jgi:hypothetical protein
MKRILCAVIALLLAAEIAAPAAASVNVNRAGEENPMVEVARSVVYGGLAGLVVGGALAVATKDNHNDGDIIRWSFATGTLVGLGMGLMWVSRRPQPTGLIEYDHGTLRAHAVLPEVAPNGGVRLVAASVKF